METILEHEGYVYILTNKRRTVLYTGVTNDLTRRIFEHKGELADGFSKKYKTSLLVYYEVHDGIDNAIIREKQIKGIRRSRKVELIEGMNPDWRDLYEEL